jgi:hypothetical protein
MPKHTCGFSLDNKIKRKNPDGLDKSEVLKNLGFDHVLLVTGEARSYGKHQLFSERY